MTLEVRRDFHNGEKNYEQATFQGTPVVFVKVIGNDNNDNEDS